MKTIIILLFILLLNVNISFAVEDICLKPTQDEIEAIKSYRLNEIKQITKSYDSNSPEIRLTANNISIIQAYKRGQYILAEHKVDCCFEGFIALYRAHGKHLKQVSVYNGYDNNGKYVGFDAKLVKRFFIKSMPKDVISIAHCWK